MARMTWEEYYKNVGIYGTTDTYELAGIWLSSANGIRSVVDWGCGYCCARRFLRKRGCRDYFGIDIGSPLADKNCSLEALTPSDWLKFDGALMRHVLEHNYDWQIILRNYLASFTKRGCLIFFIPPGEDNRPAAEEPYVDCPVLQICRGDIEHEITEVGVKIVETVELNTGSAPLGKESVWYLER